MNGEYLIRLVQGHETFRRAELEALAEYESTALTILDYRENSPFCIARLGPLSADSSASHASFNVNGVVEHPAESQKVRAASFISRSVLSKAIFELWGSGVDYESLHADIRSRTQHVWSLYQTCSFKFGFDTFCGKRSISEQREIINSLSYLGFKGKIAMKNPEAEFVIMEEWDYDSGPTSWRASEHSDVPSPHSARAPKRIFLGRLVGTSRRALIEKHDLKKRPYISTTSMDAELALVTANLALAAPNKLFLDPFVGTGGFMVAACELGALSLGSDIDGRSFRGKGIGLEKGVGSNFKKYHLESLFGDCIISDLTNTPFRVTPIWQPKPNKKQSSCHGRWLDGIISDPPYGVREGLKVLGLRNSQMRRTRMAPATPSSTTVDTSQNAIHSSDNPIRPPSSAAAEGEGQITPTPALTMQPHLINGIPAHTLPDYIAPKKPYSFNAMLHNILDFAANTLVDGGRLAFWMPTANVDPNTDTNDNTTSDHDDDDGGGGGGGGGDVENQQTQHIQETPVPTHPRLKLKYICTQSFNKWSRRLLVYERLAEHECSVDSSLQSQLEPQVLHGSGELNADDLNPFRRMYFRGFQ